jgi:hypothetical protein
VSREAVKLVLRNSRTEGCRRLVMLSLALHCHKERIPYIARVSASKVAKDANICIRYAQELLQDLDDQKEITLIASGRGRSPSVYEIHPVATCPRP